MSLAADIARVKAWLRLPLLALALLFGAAAGAGPSSSFDHFTTSFELLGQHKDVACEACHVGGIFKGTPHDCVSCHMTGSRIGATAKPTTHIMSSNDCAACHSPSGWKPVARFNHLAVMGSCSSCHNNVQTVGKTATHIPTTLDCGSCHLPTVPWKRASFAHTGITGNCMTCHNGVQAPGKPTTPVAHLPTIAACETCHSTTNFSTWAGTQMVHAGITSGCQNCHETAMSWYGVTMVDRPTAAQDALHPTAAVAPDCASCHQGFNVGDFNKIAKPAGHIPTTAACMQCHTTPGNYKLYVMGATGHKGITSGCQTCHAAGLSFLGIAPPELVETPAGHLPIPGGDDCSTCHSTTSFEKGGFGPSTPMNHAGITSGCQTCHETGKAWKGVTMVDRPTLAQDSAHPTAAQAPDCATCHQGFNVGDFNKNAKPLGHIPTTAACAQCHTSLPNFAIYTAGATLHAGITTGCATCHASGTGPWAGVGGLTFTIKQPPVNHLPINGKACETCHSPTSVATNGFGPSAPMNHTGITSGCQTCHETAMSWYGVTMVDRPTAAQDAYHPTAAAAPDCATCHQGFNVGDFNKVTTKPNGHIPTTATCTQCHQTAGNFGVYTAGTVLHKGITTGCATCHATGTGPWAGVGGLTFTIKQPPVNHLPINGKACEACHSPTSVATGGFGPSTPMNHTGITSGCQSCHETAMSWFGVTMVDRPTLAQDPAHPTAAQAPDCATCHQGFNVGDFNKNAKPLGHIPTTAACAQCHASLPNFAIYTAGATLHAGITTGCATCHASGTGPWAGVGGLTFTIKQPPVNHLPINGKACEACHSPTSVATGGFGPSTPMNHTGITSGCQNCHETAMSWYGVTMVDRPTLAQDSAHPTAAQAPDCATCHQGFNVGDFSKNAKPLGHIPTTAACAQCHTSLPNFAIYTAGTTLHKGITTGCATCHATGTGPWAGVGGLTFTIKQPPVNHLPINGKACETCHSPTSVATNGFGPSAPMNHTGITSGCQTCHETAMSWYGVTMVDRPTAAQDAFHPTVAQGADCAACHSTTNFAVGGFNIPTVLPTGHMPASLNCANCHKAIPTWSSYVMGATGHAGITSGCANCHAVGKSFLGIAPPALVVPPTTAPAHLPIPAADGCETCHSTTSFATGGFGPSTPMNHANITSGCQTCHETGMAWKGVTMVNRPTPAQDAYHPTAAASPDCATCHQGFNVGDFNNVSTKPTGHIPTTAACAQCHTTPGNYAVYTAGTALHKGITTGCATCHASGTGPWAGVGGLTFTIKQPPVNHLPINGKACETCHSPTSVATNGFGPSAPMNHTGITSGCQTCHETAMSWYGVTMVDRPTAAQDAFHPTVAQGADCAACHSTTNFAVGGFNIPTVLPTGHMPASLNCANCHKAIPTWSSYVMGATGHAGITSGCANCHAVGKSFLGIAPPALVVPPTTAPAHLPIPAADGCETCHSTTSFATGGFGPSTPMNHANITSGCQTCHETGMAWKGVTMVNRPTPAQDPNHVTAAQKADCSSAGCHSGFNVGDFNKVGKPTGHIPTTAACSQCHTTPGNYAVYTAGTTLHKGITTGCATCHATGTGPWAGVGGLTFTIKQPPVNHLPINGKACEVCHSPTSVATNGFGPSTAMNHTGITSGCQTCHETAMSWYGVTMVDRPTAAQDAFHPTVAKGADCAACHSTTNFAVGGFNIPTVLPTGHMPSSLNCANCHKAIPTWSSYVMGATGHTGITSGCANCHAVGKSFLGIAPPALVVPPTTAPAHLPIPAADGCETCHSTTSFATGGFGPSTPMNHANITSGCQTCHETGMAWKGVTMVNRPTPAQDPNHVTAAQKADCSSAGCHSNTNFAVGAFNIVGKPTGHIPTTAACSQCHTTAGNYAVYTGGATLHTGITSGCKTCHGAGTGPWAGVGGLTFTIKQPPSNHIPIGTAACEGCHSITAFTTFGNTTMKHAPVSSLTCKSCHEYTMRTANYWYGIALIWHRDSQNHHGTQDCGGSGCHSTRDGKITCTNNCGNAIVKGTVPVASIKSVKTGGSGDSAAAATTAATVAKAAPVGSGPGELRVGPGELRGGRPILRTANGAVDHQTLAGVACASCHNGGTATGKGAGHPATSDSCAACHVTLAWRPVTRVDHAETRGACRSCHDGAHAPGKAATHVQTNADCDTCHTSSAWKPAVFDHAGVIAGTCLTCHGTGKATAKPANHPATIASCDTCHYALAWRPVRRLPPAVLKKPTPAPVVAPPPRLRSVPPAAKR